MNALGRFLFAPLDNPVLRRELKLVLRRGVFEWVVLVLTVAVTLVIASVAGRSGTWVHPAQLGKVLFQTYFGLAHALVLLAGPAVAASSIAAEREGHTFEALALTGLPPATIARGKFLAAFTHVGAYVLALAPVGALPFLFGGVAATTVVLAFAMLAVTTALATLLGLAISARLTTTRSALITSVVAGALLAVALWFGVGTLLGTEVCRAFGVAWTGTLWLPVLVGEGGLAGSARAALTLGPLVPCVLAGWFLFEVCVANLADPSADRTSGLKRWYLVTAAVLAAGAGLAVATAGSRTERAEMALFALAGVVLFATLGAFVFQGDAIAAPRRVRLWWKARRAGAFRRFLGPGLTSSATLQLVVAAAAIAFTSLLGLGAALGDDQGPVAAPLGVVVFAVPACTVVLWTVGLATYLRVRAGVGAGRVALAVIVVVAYLAPYALAAVLHDAADTDDSLSAYVTAASPAYALEVAFRVVVDQADARELLAAVIAAAGYGVVGLVALVAGVARADRVVAELDAGAEKTDARIEQEDRETARASSSAVTEPPPASRATAQAASAAPAEEEAQPRASGVEPAQGAEHAGGRDADEQGAREERAAKAERAASAAASSERRDGAEGERAAVGTWGGFVDSRPPPPPDEGRGGAGGA